MEPTFVHRSDPDHFTDDDDDGTETGRYEVEAILDRRVKPDIRAGKHQVEYLIKWAGYDESHNLWVPEDNLDGCQTLLREFLDTLAM